MCSWLTCFAALLLSFRCRVVAKEVSVGFAGGSAIELPLGSSRLEDPGEWAELYDFPLSLRLSTLTIYESVRCAYLLQRSNAVGGLRSDPGSASSSELAIS